MKRHPILAAAAWLAAVAGVGAPARAAEALRVCLQSDDPPLSSRATGEGFDVALSRRIGDRLGRPLAIQWFVTRKDPDSNPPREASALLSDGRCQLLAGYTLIADALGHLDAAKGKLPPFEGRTADDRHRWIMLQDLIASRPYRFDALAVVLSAAHSGLKVRKLADLSGLRLGVEIHGVPDLIATRYEQGLLEDRVVHYTDTAALLADLDAGKIDAALVDLHQFDAWRARHPATRIAPSGYTHSIGFNIGFVGIAPEKPLIAEVNRIIADMLADHELPALAARSGLTWLPPRAPEVASHIPLAAFGGD